MKAVFKFFAQFCEIPRLVLSTEEVDKILEPPEPRQLHPIALSEVENATSLRRIHFTVQQSSKQFVTLPHTASHQWKDLLLLMTLQVLGSLFFQVIVFFAPLNSVNDGIKSNRTFNYVFVPIFELIGLCAWVESCNYAMPELKLPLRARGVAILIGMLVQFLLTAIITEEIGEEVYPIPFSTLVTGTAALLFAIPSLILMTPNLKEHWAKWKLCISMLFKIVISIFVAALWAASFRILAGSMWQKVIAFLFVPLQLACKNLLVAPTAALVNPYRYVFFILVVDMLFSRFQVATLPFIEGYSSLPVLILPPAIALFFRYYSGTDRLALIFGSHFRKLASGDGAGVTIIENRLRSKGISQMGFNMISCTCSAVHEMSLQVHRSKRNLDDDNTLYSEWSTRDVMSDMGFVVATKADETVNEDDESNVSINEDELQIRQLEEGRSNGSLDSIEELEESNIEEESQNDIEEDLEMGTMVHVEYDNELENDHARSDGESDNESIQMNIAEETSASPLFVDPPELIDQLVDPEIRIQEKLEETWWMQRQLFHIVESVGCEVLTTIVQVQSQIAIILVRSLPIRSHLNETYDVSMEQWQKALAYGWIQVLVNIIIIGILGGVCFRYLEKLGDRKLKMSAVISYIFRDNFWFLFLWLAASGALACSTFIDHFGADMTLRFEWLHCEGGEMAWPGCLHK